MTKEVLARILAKVQNLESNASCPLSVEEAGILQAYVESREQREAISAREWALVDRVRGLLAAWQVSAGGSGQTDGLEGPERRTQWMLRTAVDKLLQGSFETVTRSEIQLARGTLGALGQHQTPTPSQQRLHRLLADALEKYDRRLETLAVHDEDAPADPDEPIAAPSVFEAAVIETPMPEDGLPSKSQAAQQVDANECFQGGRPTTTENLAGIPVNIRARRFEFRGHIEIVGDVPDDVLVVVRRGGASIQGCIFGYVVASDDITSTGNIQNGLALSEHGSIVLDRALPGAKVVAQQGNVSCNGVESSRCLFAADALTVHGNVVGGKLVARKIDVEGTVASAELHGAGAVRATRFELGPRRKMVLCLRKTITCQEYGRPLDEAALGCKRASAKYGYQIAVSSRAVRYIRRDIINCHRSMLYYLLAGVDNNVAIRLLRALQTQLIFFEQIIAAGESLSSFLHTTQEAGEQAVDSEIAGVAEECLKTLKRIEKEIAVIPEEFGATTREQLTRASRQLAAVTKRIIQAVKTTLKVSTYVAPLDKRLADWRDQLHVTAGKIDRLVAELGLDSQTSAKIEGEPAALEPMLAEVLAEARATPESERARRAQSPVMRVMQTSVTRHRENIKYWVARIDRATGDQEGIRANLRRNAVVFFSECHPNPASVHAAHYDEGVELTALPGTMDITGTDEVDTVRIEAPIDCATTFVLENRRIRRCAPGP